MKYIKKFEKIKNDDTFYHPTQEELNEYPIKKGDYVIAPDYYRSGPYFVDDIVKNDIGKVLDVFVSNKGYLNEAVYCLVLYKNLSDEQMKYFSNEKIMFQHSVQMKYLKSVSKEEYEDYVIKKESEKYNL